MNANSTEKKPRPSWFKPLLVLGLVVAVVAGAVFFTYYVNFFAGNVTGKRKYLYVRTGSRFGDVMKSLSDSGILKNTERFRRAAEKMKYTRIKPGKYRLKEGMGNRTLINTLKSGNQEPVRIKFQGKRLKTNFAALVATQLEADSASLMKLLDSPTFVENLGFTTDNVYTLFIPNSYELWWNTNAAEFIERMHTEYKKFWSRARQEKADAIHLNPVQVSILASIVDSEALYDDEMPTIAGLYLNRLKRGIKLQSDPTVIFATGDFTIRRVLNRHLRFPSPYNTYIHTGLPPGPVMMPSISAIDAVLNAKASSYLFMCAKEDFSGYHNFAATQAEHDRNADRYRRALDARNIKN